MTRQGFGMPSRVFRCRNPHGRKVLVLYLERPRATVRVRTRLGGRFCYSDLEEATGVCLGCGQVTGIESTFARNRQNNKEIAARAERRFRGRLKPMMSEVSHA